MQHLLGICQNKIKYFTGMITQIKHSRSWKHSPPWFTAPPCSTSRELPVIIQADASKDGLWMCLLQNSILMACTSKFLIDAETWYASIERELLAACLHLSASKPKYTVTSSETDHKLLEMIALKNLTVVCHHLLQMFLCIP